MMTLLASVGAALGALAAYGALYAAWATRRWPADGRMVTAGPFRLHVKEAGDARPNARPILLVHGAAANARVILRDVGDILGGLGPLIAPDRPGFGHSPAFPDHTRLATHAAALAALIDAENLSRPLVVGHSYGGAVALRLALEYPERVGALLLLGTASHGYVGPVSWYNYAASAPLLGRLFTRCLIPIAAPPMAASAVRAGFAPQSPPPDHAQSTGLGLLFRPASFRANALDLVRANQELAVQELRYTTLSTPTAIIAGEDDPTVYTHRHSTPLAAAAQDTRLALAPGVGHQVAYGAPTLIREHAEALLAELDTPTSAPEPAV